MTPIQAERLHHLDALRCVLMLLGIPYHAALIYAPDRSWRIDSLDDGPLFAVLADLLHGFRMPAFFLLAGILVAGAIRRAGPAGFLSGRARRLLIPLAAAALTLNTFQLWLAFRVEHPEAGPGLLPFAAALAEAWRDGTWTLHLWFLIDLFLYASLAAAAGTACARPAAARLLGSAASWIDASLRRRPTALLALGAVYAVGVGGLSRVFGPLDGYALFGTVEIQRFLFNLPFFAFGAFLGHSKISLARFSTFTWPCAAVAAATLAASVILPDTGSAASKVAHHALRGLAAWSACRVILGLAASAFPRRVPWVDRLASAAFTIYLLHHPVVLASGAFLLGWPAPTWLEFMAIVSLSIGLPYLIHVAAIGPSPWLRFLFNGATLPAKRPGPSRPLRSRTNP